MPENIISEIKNFILDNEVSQYNTEYCNELVNKTFSIIDTPEKDLLKDFLHISARSSFLKKLDTRENLLKWSELAFKIIQKTEYGLLDMFSERVKKHPSKILFNDMSLEKPVRWTYEQIFTRISEIASLFLSMKNENPRVAIYMNNSVDAACIDLACLCYDIFDTPISIHFSSDIIAYIINELDIDIIVTDNDERLRTVRKAIQKSGKPVKCIISEQNIGIQAGSEYFLNKESKKFTRENVKEILNQRTKKSIKEVATTMFTSGSTGMPKGVSFSIYNIVSKRFARAAAVPQVGENEEFLCFLPLFHTFGRFLELIGSIYWSATYIMSGNTSSATILKLFPQVKPSVFISVPIRWVQLYEKCMQETGDAENFEQENLIVRSVVGEKLKWGLSAAGYLDPKIFRYFEKHGINLCSGFGMTEATGGITMTEPGKYTENSTGIALPGVQTFIKENGELCIKGHYIAKYLEDARPGQIIEFPENDNHIIETGDIFIIRPDGHHEIIDRVKDIYKNNKGQTVAPGMIEKKFAGVPGIKRTFLVGDGKPYNVLLIVPDFEDSLIEKLKNTQNLRAYYHQIIMSANKDLAPYERVINFSILERDFTEDKNELTPKGSFKRNVIKENYAELINGLYISDKITIDKPGFSVIIPRWFYRDLGILETDIKATESGIQNIQTKQDLRIKQTDKPDTYIIGDLVYTATGGIIDLGRLIRQPKLWVANPELVDFSPCKEGYDTGFHNFGSTISLPEISKNYKPDEISRPKKINRQELVFINEIFSVILHSDPEHALRNLKVIESEIPDFDKNFIEIISSRLAALAWHESEKVRVTAYRILISSLADMDFSQILPVFINSGKVFMDKESIHKIALNNIGKIQLDALRKSMYFFRKTLKFPAQKSVIIQFEAIFDLLLDMGKTNPEYFSSIASEFASWMILKEAPFLSARAKDYFYELKNEFNKKFINKTGTSQEEIRRVTFFDEGIYEEQREEIRTKICDNNFINRSIYNVFDEHDFQLSDLSENGIWISRIRSYTESKLYRMSINTKKGKHFDLHITIDPHMNTEQGTERILTHIAVAQHPVNSAVLAKFGCFDPENSILSTRYLSELSLWEKIRALAELQSTNGLVDLPNVWRKIYIKSMSSFFKAWDNLNRKKLPGYVSPTNVVVPETDFAEMAKIISLAGIKEIDTVSPLFTNMLQNFYLKTEAHYPQVRKHLNKSWIFHSLVETFDQKEAGIILRQLKTELESQEKLSPHNEILYENLLKYLEKFDFRIYLPLALFNGIDRYTDWRIKNPEAASDAKLQTIAELFELYKLNKYPEIVRYKFYRDTYFFDGSTEATIAFDKLLQTMQDDIHAIPIQLIELSDLQEAVNNDHDKIAFQKMVFPHISTNQEVEIVKVRNKTEEQVLVRSVLTDKRNVEFIMREPADPNEVGELYKLFFAENYPKEVSKPDKHFVVTDSNERVVAGLCYKTLDNNIVLLDGTVVSSPLHGRGLGTAMINDFFIRMEAAGIKFIKAHFLFGNYYLKHNFKIDKKWGALVKELNN